MPETRKKQPKRPRTDRAALDRLPQFNAPTRFDISDFDSETGKYRSLPAEESARALLNEAIQAHAASHKIEQFVRAAISAIATYESQCGVKAAYDRAKAAKLLRHAAVIILKTREALQKITQWRELSSFLEELYVKAPAPPTGDKSARGLQARMRQRDQKRAEFRNLSPQTVATSTLQLEAILSLALERVEFRPGEFQYGYAAQILVDELAYAWLSASGKLPTFSKPSPRSRNPSPFANLLKTINQQIIPPQCRSGNDFRDYALRSIRHLKKVSGQPHTSRPRTGR